MRRESNVKADENVAGRKSQKYYSFTVQLLGTVSSLLRPPSEIFFFHKGYSDKIEMGVTLGPSLSCVLPIVFNLPCRLYIYNLILMSAFLIVSLCTAAYMQSVFINRNLPFYSIEGSL